MSDARESSDRLAELVADGRPVDWDQALHVASDDHERRLIGHLRLLESVAHVHRIAGAATLTSQRSLTMTATRDAPPLADPPPAIGTWAHLELREKLGEGAFGEVYRAWDRHLEREVALKLLKTAASKVVEEGRLLAKLRHPNVITVYGAERHEGRFGLWMEFIRGRSLEQLLRDQGPFGAREAAVIGIDLCRALAAVHRAGVLHRDVKAQNVMREDGGRIVLMDFGAGVDVGDSGGEVGGELAGTPLYMAPEFFHNREITARADIYSLGVLLYHLVTVSYPVQAMSLKELRRAHEQGKRRLLRDARPDLPDDLIRALEKAVSRHPEDRYATVGEMEVALRGISGLEGTDGEIRPQEAPSPGPPTRRSRGRQRLIAAAAVVAAGMALLMAVWVIGHNWWGQPYTVEAVIHRATQEGSDRLPPGARIEPGDELFLEFRASRPVHVYIINQDDRGESFLLFPLPDLEMKNPLPPNVAHRLPGRLRGKEFHWVVSTAGGREHFVIIASPERLVEFEEEALALARPEVGPVIAARLAERAVTQLRAVGELAEAKPSPGSEPANRLFETAAHLASMVEGARGVWVRQFDLENPAP